MSMFSSAQGSGVGGMQQGEDFPMESPRANQACATCRKQKRKCSKQLPSCALCLRMNRTCDYSDSAPNPTAEDFNSLRGRLMELEAKLSNGGGSDGGMNSQAQYNASTVAGLAEQALGAHVAYNPQHDVAWHGLQNRFPTIAFLDGDSYKTGGFVVPKPSLQIPNDVNEYLGDDHSLRAIIGEYFATTHRWMPIVSHKRLTKNMVSPMWEAGPDLALLFLAMKLIASKPMDGIESSQNPLYLSTKRFVALLEASGAASLTVLQAAILVAWYEYGQAIYPAAFMTAGWCVRYGNLLGINGLDISPSTIGKPNTWAEQEERRRAWWGVQVVDRLVSMRGQYHIPNSQEPQHDDYLPVDDQAWDEEEISGVNSKWLYTPLDEPAAPFPRLCQASFQMGKVLSHHFWNKSASELVKFEAATSLYTEISILTRTLSEEASDSSSFLDYSAPLALCYSTLRMLLDLYSSPDQSNEMSADTVAMQKKAAEGLKEVTKSVVEFAEQINVATPTHQELDRLSPIIMDALYSAASNYAWTVRESGEEYSQLPLDSLIRCLRRLSPRWRNAAEYSRILDARELSYAVSSA